MLVAVDVDMWFVLLALSRSRLPSREQFTSDGSPEAGVWGQLKMCCTSCRSTRMGLESSSLFSPVSSEWGNSSSGVCDCRLCRWQESLIDSPFSPCHRCLSSCQTKRQLYVDLLYIGISLFPFFFTFGNLKISCQKVYCLVFRMRLSLHILWLMGILSCFFLWLGSCLGASDCVVCELRQRSLKIDVTGRVRHRLDLQNNSWKGSVLAWRVLRFR